MLRYSNSKGRAGSLKSKNFESVQFLLLFNTRASTLSVVAEDLTFVFSYSVSSLSIIIYSIAMSVIISKKRGWQLVNSRSIHLYGRHWKLTVKLKETEDIRLAADWMKDG